MANGKRLIDISKVIDAMQRCIDEEPAKQSIACITFEAIIECLMKEPVIDAVEVVRCKDCKYCYCQRCSNPVNGWLPNRGTLDFCSFAERRTDNGRI